VGRARHGFGQRCRSRQPKHPFQIGSDSLIQRAIMERAAIASNNLTTTEETIYTTTGTSLPGCVACIPMTINGRVQGVVVADSAQQNFDDFALFSILTGVSTIAIEQLPFKEKIGFSNFTDLVDETIASSEEDDTSVFDDNDSPFEEPDLNDISQNFAPLPEETEVKHTAASEEITVSEHVVSEEPEIAETTATEEHSKPVDLSIQESDEVESLEDYAKELESELGESFGEIEIDDTSGMADSIVIPEMNEEVASPSPAEEEIAEEVELVNEESISIEASDDSGEMLEIDTESFQDSSIEFLDEPYESEVQNDVIADEPLELQPEQVVQQEEEIPVLQAEEHEISKPDSTPSEYYDSLSLSGYNLEKYDEKSERCMKKLSALPVFLFLKLNFTMKKTSKKVVRTRI
jgi:hypothetical protein